MAKSRKTLLIVNHAHVWRMDLPLAKDLFRARLDPRFHREPKIAVDGEKKKCHRKAKLC